MGLGVSAAILAGGRARRLGGADKASLPIGDARIIDRQLAALSAVADDIRIVANDRDRYAGLGLRVIPDAVTERGPLGGLYTALLDASHDRMLVLACDLPFVTAALLQRLVAESGTGQEIDAVVPRSARGLEPLCALYCRRCAGRVLARHRARRAGGRRPRSRTFACTSWARRRSPRTMTDRCSRTSTRRMITRAPEAGLN